MDVTMSKLAPPIAGTLAVVLLATGCRVQEQPATTTQSAATESAAQPDRALSVYAPSQHPLYDGRFVLSGSNVYQVGTLSDPSPWDHMGDAGVNVRPVAGTIEIDVNELANTGTFRAALQLPEGPYIVELERFEEFSPCQDGGIAAWLYEHGDSGCGDANWPKSLLYVAGWGWGRATLNGEPFHQDYQIHFMVTQGMRDRTTLAVRPDMTGSDGAGAINPAQVQLDFYIRSPESNEANHPTRAVFDHFFAMDVTWR
jgi:hypothetical protein